MGSLIVKKIISCARCGDDHLNVLFESLDHPFAPPEAGGLAWTYWAPCPLNGQPILLMAAANSVDDGMVTARPPEKGA